MNPDLIKNSINTGVFNQNLQKAPFLLFKY